MKKLFSVWKETFTKFFDVNQNGKIDFFEYILFGLIVIVYNLFFEIIGNYIYDYIR